MIGLGYKDSLEVVAKIDQIVFERRRANPSVTFSRAAFLREAVNRALAEAEVPPTQIRVRMRERYRSAATAPVKPVAPASVACPGAP
jgi:hypothetical protein